MPSLNKLFFKYLIYCPILLIRGEWIFHYLSKLKKTQYATREQIEKIQLDRLNRLISHAKETVPYYKNITSSQLESLTDLKNIPLLEKSDLRGSLPQLYSNSTGLKSRPKTTGGSTGAAVTLRKSAKGMAQELAASWRGYSWAGIDIGDKQARFWGVPHGRKDRLRAKMIDFIANRKRLSAFAFSESDFVKYVKELEAYHPKYFYGYVSMIRQFAEYIEREDIHHSIRPSAIITTAEVLSSTDREIIERVFNCRVFNEYGCGEVGTIAHECEHGNLHINSENIIIEVIGGNGEPLSADEPGEIVVTDLVNYSMPLIRYRIKDFGVLSLRKCECGVNLPVIKEVFGREYDYLINEEGEKFHGEFFLYLVEDLSKQGVSINGVQFIQDDELNITVKIVSDEVFDFEDYFSRQIKELMRSMLSVTVERVSCIMREPSGKLRVVKRL